MEPLRAATPSLDHSTVRVLSLQGLGVTPHLSCASLELTSWLLGSGTWEQWDRRATVKAQPRLAQQRGQQQLISVSSENYMRIAVFNMWNNKYRFLIFVIYIEQKIQAISVIWRCSYAELPPPPTPRHNGSRVNRQRSVGMLDSVTSRPEFCYSAPGSAQPTSCCASQSSASAGPCLRPHRMGKKKHTPLSPSIWASFTSSYATTHSDRQVIEYSISSAPQLSEHFCCFNSFRVNS